MATKKTTKERGTAVESVVPCLTFSERGEEAVRFYVGTFKNSKITSMVKTEAGGPLPPGQLLHAAFELNGQEFTALDGGPSFNFSQGFSMVATCKTQKELDAVWDRLCEGGQPGPCGWLTDKFGVSWQVVPAALGEMMMNPKGGDTGKMMQALLKMGKLDIAALKKAYEGR